MTKIVNEYGKSCRSVIMKDDSTSVVTHSIRNLKPVDILLLCAQWYCKGNEVI